MSVIDCHYKGGKDEEREGVVVVEVIILRKQRNNQAINCCGLNIIWRYTSRFTHKKTRA